MSTYQTVEIGLAEADLQYIASALDEMGIPYTMYEQGNGIYRKWRSHVNHNTTAYHRGDRLQERNLDGTFRGSDASLVIHGGLDTTKMRYCGDTAFIVQPDGSLRVELDIAHNNASRNWEELRNRVTLSQLQDHLARQGRSLANFEMQPDGTIRAQLKVPTRSHQARTMRR